MSQYAALEVPSNGDHSKGPALEAVNLASFCLAAVVVTARVLYRMVKTKQTSWDDYTIIISTVAAALNTAFIVKYVESGGGRHAYYLGMSALDAKKWSTVAQIPFILSTTLTKVSIALMILRISNSRKLKWSMAPLIAIVVCVNFTGLIMLVAGCTPFEGQWNYMIQRKCWPREAMMSQNWLQGAVSIASDFIYTSLPIFVVWGLNITRRQKVAISGLIALGLLWISHLRRKYQR
ncbi:hypothetical protein BU26DRAFT_432477 [Trematosphaeria pertusa]|uniref:Rhodopsin domain-containing protein n=1 Tax=Trematosphaeria pertusa TaxID=390896 RepID=A0A6A6I7J0_9PLEO|nr:uncharacterized protein BU26DRAFT_432477 [Trematosphaeria pertusa]KAF2245922.1 hypothetical protein BU26DRAFT_432477 [Trematosphaeria pertusa]